MEEEPTILEETIVPKGGSNPAPQHTSAPSAPEEKAPVPVTAVPDPAAFVARIPSAPPIVPPGSTAIPRPDMSQMLSSIKLPDRKDFRGAADKKIPVVEERHEMPVVVAMPHEPQTNLTATLQAPGQENKESDSSVVPVHTLKQDLEGIVTDQKMSMVHAVAMEQDKKRGQDNVVAQSAANSQRVRRTTMFIFASFVLVALGGAALFGVATIMSQRSSAGGAALPTSSLLFAEQSVAFPMGNNTPAAIKQTLAQARMSSTGAVGSIVQIVPTVTETDPTTNASSEREASFSEFMRAIGSHAPDDLIRALGDKFFLGIHSADQSAPVLVVPVTSYDRAFSGMLAWENVMNMDLAPVFTQVPVLTMGADNLPTQRHFEDEVMRNYDTRTLKDDSGKIRLYYSFPSRSILVIAENPYSFAEVLSRLQAQRRL